MPDTRTYVTLKPMAAGASGFARLEGHAGGLTLQWQGKGLRCRAARAYLYAADGTLRELGACAVNPQGQASLRASLPNRDWHAAPVAPAAIFAVSDEPAPRPLLLGLFVRETSGALLDAKNALLALCARLGDAARSREPPGDDARASAAATGAADAQAPESVRTPDNTERQRVADTPSIAAGAHATDSEARAANDASRSDEPPAPAVAQPIVRKRKRARRWHVLHEPAAHLPAIDPAVYIRAEQSRASAMATALPEPDASLASALPLEARAVAERRVPSDDTRAERDCRSVIKQCGDKPALDGAPHARQPRAQAGKPVDCLPRLRWAKPFAQLAPLFERYPPFAPFVAPGWRFVRVPMRQGFFAVGRLARDGKVERVAYALPGTEDAPPPPAMRGYRFARGRDGQGYWTCQRDASGD